MRVDPVIAALRGDRAPQREAQTAMVSACDAWRGEPDNALVLREFDDFGAGVPIEDCPALFAMMSTENGDCALIESFCRQFSATLDTTILGHLPLRHGFDGRRSTLLLARSGRAQLSLHALEPDAPGVAVNAPTQVSFSDGVRFDTVLAGKARGRLVTGQQAAEGMSLSCSAIDLDESVHLSLDLTCEALQVLQVERRLVSLRLIRNLPEPRPTRAYRLSDGRFTSQAEGDIRSSRQEMMLALLGRMERADAALEMAALARETGRDALRWQALRESLALDTAEGFAALADVSRDSADPLCANADALRAQLVAQYPQLLELERELCPA